MTQQRTPVGVVAAGGVCALANGIQRSNATTARIAHTPNAPRQPYPIKSPSGTVLAAATAAKPLIAMV